MVKKGQADRHDTEVGIPHPTTQQSGRRKSPLTNTMPIARKSIFNRPQIAHKVYLEVHGLESGILACELGEETITLGRSPDCNVHLPLANVSRVHAQVAFRNDEYYLEDLDSTNGTYVNGIRIKKCLLRNNDQIDIGEARIHFIEEKTVGKP